MNAVVRAAISRPGTNRCFESKSYLPTDELFTSMADRSVVGAIHWSRRFSDGVSPRRTQDRCRRTPEPCHNRVVAIFAESHVEMGPRKSAISLADSHRRAGRQAHTLSRGQNSDPSEGTALRTHPGCSLDRCGHRLACAAGDIEGPRHVRLCSRRMRANLALHLQHSPGGSPLRRAVLPARTFYPPISTSSPSLQPHPRTPATSTSRCG